MQSHELVLFSSWGRRKRLGTPPRTRHGRILAKGHQRLVLSRELLLVLSRSTFVTLHNIIVLSPGVLICDKRLLTTTIARTGVGRRPSTLETT